MLQFDHTNFKKSNQKFVLICFYLYSLLAGSIHSEVWHLFEETVSKFQIFIYGPRWSGHSALDYYSKSHYYGIRFEILPTKFDQVEFCHFSNERPVWRIRPKLLSQSLLRTAHFTSQNLVDENFEIFRSPLDRRSDAPWKTNK